MSGMDGMKYGAGLTPEARLARLEQLLIPRSIGTTEGDLIGFDDNGNPVRIPAAAGNGYALSSDISQVGGVTWAAKPTYTAPTYSGTWANYGTWRAGGYLRDRDGLVHLTGLIKRTGTSGIGMFTLPVGYRPSSPLIFQIQATWGGSTQNVRCDIQTSGSVELVTEPGVAIEYLSLNSFPPFLGEA